MKKCWAIFFLCLLQVVASAQQSMPSGAGKYHELLHVFESESSRA
jgi:hypothetical protein